MYHIINDKRSKKTKYKIYLAILSLSKEKSFSTISVTDIFRKTKISRSTFYRNFDNIIDAIDYQCSSIFDRCITKYIENNKSYNRKKFLEKLFEEIDNERDLVRLILKIKRFDIVYNNLLIYINNLLKNYNYHIDDREFYNYLVSIITSIGAGAISIWIEGQSNMTPSEVVELIDRAMKTILSK